MKNIIFIIAAVIIFRILVKIIVEVYIGTHNAYVRLKVKKDLNRYSKWCKDNKEEPDKDFLEHEAEIDELYNELYKDTRGE